jgi:hypothetical protein
MRNIDEKRLKTNIERYGKKGTFGSKESIKNQRKSIFRNNLGITDEEFDYLTDDQIKATYSRFCSQRSKNKILIRIQKHFKLNDFQIETLSDQEFGDYKKIVYVEALVTKGRKVVLENNFGNPDEMTKEELLKYSGHTKKMNASSRTTKQKQTDSIKWKTTHLKNYYDKNIDYNEFNNEQIDDLYRNYLNDSGRLENTTVKGRGGKWQKGWYHSEKFNCDIFYRSSYEKHFLEFCENNDIITKIDFHLKGIKYIWKNQSHWYFPDFLINEKHLIEIKAKYQLKEEQTQKKIETGYKFAHENNIKYVVITEIELFGDNLCNLF